MASSTCHDAISNCQVEVLGGGRGEGWRRERGGVEEGEGRGGGGRGEGVMEGRWCTLNWTGKDTLGVLTVHVHPTWR